MLIYLSQNLGIGFVLPNEIEYYDKSRFVALPVRDFSFPIGFTYRKDHPLSKTGSEFLALLGPELKKALSKQ